MRAGLRRWLYALRSLEPDLGRRLASWRLSVVLMVLAALYYGFLVIWSTSSPPQVVSNIASLLPFWLVYALLLVNTGFCLWRRLPALRRQLARGPTLTGRPPSWEAPVAERSGEAALRRRGYRPAWASEGVVGGIRYRWAPLGTFLFHGAFFLVALGFLASLGARREATAWVAVGEAFEARPDQFLSISAPPPLGGAPATPGFEVVSIRPEFWGDLLLFTTLEADLRLADGGLRTTRINRPLWLGWGTFVRLAGFGYAPRYQLETPAGELLESDFVKLNVFPPGREDFFSPQGFPHTVYLEVLPDYAVEAGRPITRSMNLAAPAAIARIFRGRLDLGRAVLRAGDSFTFEGLTLSVPEIRYWGEFALVRDPGAPVLFFGYLVAIAGLALKARGPRLEAEWRPTDDGGLLRGWGGPPPDAAREAT